MSDIVVGPECNRENVQSAFDLSHNIEGVSRAKVAKYLGTRGSSPSLPSVLHDLKSSLSQLSGALTDTVVTHQEFDILHSCKAVKTFDFLSLGPCLSLCPV